MPTEHPRVLATTHQAAGKGISDETIKHRPFLAMLEALGNIKFDCTGRAPSWGVKFKNIALNPLAEAQQLVWARSQKYKRAEVELRGYYLTDIITEKEKLQNRGPQQLYDVYGTMVEEMKADYKQQFPYELLTVDGNATGNEDKFHGLPSWFGDDGTAVDATVLVNPSDTYATLSTIYGNYGGSSGDPQYDFWSPVLINSGNNGGTFANQATDIMRRIIQELSYGNSSTDSPTVGLLTKAAYRDALADVTANEQVFRKLGPDESLALKAGYKKVFEYDGVDWLWDHDVNRIAAIGNASAFQGYVLNLNYLELWFWHKNMLLAGSQWDPNQLSFKFWLNFWGNMVCKSPRHQGIIQTYA